MTPHSPNLRDLCARLDAEARALTAALPPATLVASVTVAAPACTVELLPPPGADAVYWAQPERSVLQLGLGRAHAWSASGARRFAELGTRAQALRAAWTHRDADATGARPLAFAGFAYDPDETADGRPNLELRVPELLLARAPGGGARATLSWRADAGVAALERTLANAAVWLDALPRVTAGEPAPLERVAAMPSDEMWRARVRQAVTDIRGGRLEKVVLSRRVRYRAPEPVDAARVLRACRAEYPGCTHFAWSGADGVLLGASPERLVALGGRQVVSDAIAGTAPRSASPPEDERLEVGLRVSGKIGQEHHPVVTSIARQLLPLCDELELPEEAGVLKLANAQHLWIPISGRVKGGVDLPALLERLHPTPAVGGTPREAALAWQASHGERRGAWYAGAVGWMDRDGDGEFSVVLRSAWIAGRDVDLFAGAGIVAESDPEAELAETEIKLCAMLDVIEESHAGALARSGRRR
ncbi:MAG: isochorismate synthase [Pseudomonadota bacterium]